MTPLQFKLHQRPYSQQSIFAYFEKLGLVIIEKHRLYFLLVFKRGQNRRLFFTRLFQFTFILF